MTYCNSTRAKGILALMALISGYSSYSANGLSESIGTNRSQSESIGLIPIGSDKFGFLRIIGAAVGQSCPISKSATSDRSPVAPCAVAAPYAPAVLCTSYVPPCAPMVCQQCVFAPPLCISSAVRPRRGWRAVDRAARLSLDEEALRIVTHAEQIGAFCIGG